MAGVIRTRTPGLGTANVAYKERIQRGFFTGVPCCAGAGSRGIKLRPSPLTSFRVQHSFVIPASEPGSHAAIFPPRGPSAGNQRPSRPYGLRSLTQKACDKSCWQSWGNFVYLKKSNTFLYKKSVKFPRTTFLMDTRQKRRWQKKMWNS